MRRRLLNLLTALSLVLFVAVVALWVRSYFVVEGVSASTAPGALKLVICCGKGTLYLAVHEKSSGRHLWLFRSSPPVHVPFEYARRNTGDLRFYRLGFGFLRAYWQKYWAVTCPCWFAVICSGAAPTATAISRWREARKAARCLCPSCGYDLRATPARCPECGTAASVSTSG